ncbi:MAG: gamma-butyrobetaine hydroxylase-like domain-containing protein [Candidatus Tectimicrobiota bacterium]
MKAPDPATKPLKIQRLQEAQTLRIEWADEHVCEMPYAHLRRACPCTLCTSGREEAATGLRVVTGEAPHDEGSLQINDISLVGAYAIILLWNDGHDTGIYPFRFLRELCPHGGAGLDAAQL